MSPDARRVATLVELGRYAEARTRVRALLATDPDDVDLHALHADALAGEGDHAGALAAASRVVALAPDDPAGHRRCADALAGLGHDDQALRAARETVRLAPEAWWAHALLAATAARTPAGLEDAWDASGRAVALAPDQPDAHAAVGFVAARRGDRRTAVRAYRAVLALRPDHAVAVHNLALLEGGTDVTRIAEGVAGALRLDPQNRDFRDTADRWTRKTVVGIWVVPLALLLLVVPASLDNPPEQAGSAFPTSASATVLLVAVLVGWWVWTLARLPAGIRRRAAAYLRHDPGLLAMLVTAVLGVGAVLLIGFSPRQVGLVLGTAGVVVGASLLSLAGSLVTRARRRAGP